MTWTRDHDRDIAEKIEGIEVHYGNANWPEGGFMGMATNPMDLYYVRYTADRSSQCPVSIPHYDTDIGACIRAAEKWCSVYPARYFQIRYLGADHAPDPWVANLTEIKNGHLRTHSSGDLYHAPASALAWALHNTLCAANTH